MGPTCQVKRNRELTSRFIWRASIVQKAGLPDARNFGVGAAPGQGTKCMPLNEASTLAQSQNAPASDSFQMQQDYRKKLYTFPAGLPVPIRVAMVSS